MLKSYSYSNPKEIIKKLLNTKSELVCTSLDLGNAVISLGNTLKGDVTVEIKDVYRITLNIDGTEEVYSLDMLDFVSNEGLLKATVNIKVMDTKIMFMNR